MKYKDSFKLEIASLCFLKVAIAQAIQAALCVSSLPFSLDKITKMAKIGIGNIL